MVLNRYVEQLVTSAEAAVEEVIRRGVSWIKFPNTTYFNHFIFSRQMCLTESWFCRWHTQIKLLLGVILMGHSWQLISWHMLLISLAVVLLVLELITGRWHLLDSRLGNFKFYDILTFPFIVLYMIGLGFYSSISIYKTDISCFLFFNDLWASISRMKTELFGRRPIPMLKWALLCPRTRLRSQFY